MPNSRHDEDLDSILSNIMHDKKPVASDTYSNVYKDKKSKQKHNHKEKVNKAPKQYNVRHRKTLRYVISGALVVAIVIFAGFGIYKLSSSLLSPSPFTADVKESVDYDLYYPTDLPNDFKIETDSIQQAEGGVVIYAISDNAGKRITISSQKLPAEIDTASLVSQLNDVYDLETSNGVAKVGKAENNILIASLTIDDTWLLINTPNGNVSTDELNQVLSSIKKG